ncbi:glutamate-cysteine ligase family protein [Streptosporangium sp. NPDC006013]|uniref:glutamate-cysteine ligase family protein n=1 Tax=Streptosporangium sp. NPDC006013 TaxID=3155596 RepID=UPI00339FECB9
MNRVLTERTATKWIYDNAFSRDRIGRIGVELEWFVVRTKLPEQRLGIADISSCLGLAGGHLPMGGTISFEPGGQLELSTAPADTLAECLEVAAGDLALIRGRAARHDLSLMGKGLDDRPAVRVVDLPRYVALEHNYDQFGPSGRILMCNAASVQVNIDAGDASPGWRGWRRRWWLVNTLGPIFMAMFANSPMSVGSMAQSGRQLLRFQSDPTRTDPLPLSGDPREAWVRYVLDAQVVGVSQAGSRALQRPVTGLTMRRWLRGAGPREVFLDDLRCHLQSVVPPVRPRGYLELRMIDAQSDDNWVVPVVTVGALLDDPYASAEAMRVVESLPRPAGREDWVNAARKAMSEHHFAEAAKRCMAAAIEALDRLEVPDWAHRLVLGFADAYTFRSRCPADDLVVEEAA